MSLSNEAINTKKLNVGNVSGDILSGITLGKVLPGLFTTSGPAYFGLCPGLGIDRATVSIGTKVTGPIAPIPLPGVCGLEITAAPCALISNGINFLNGATTITGVSLTIGADASAGVTAVAGAQAEAGPKANASAQATAGTTTASTTVAGLGVFASVAAPFKTFNIAHPLKENYRLVYAALEGPEMGVYFRGKTTEKVIELPYYWTGLVHEESITVQLTPIGKACSTLHVKKIEDNKVYVGHQATTLEYYYIIHAERKDTKPLVVEYEGTSVEDYRKSSTKILANGDYANDKYVRRPDPLP
jgi:hypothetical protein